MSTCSNFMVNTGALFTRKFLQGIHQSRRERQAIVMMGRFSGLALTLLGILFAVAVERVLDAFLFTETIAALMGVMFLGGMLWKRANRYGARAATLGAFLTYYALNYLMSCRAGEGPETFLDPDRGVPGTGRPCSSGDLFAFLDTVRTAGVSLEAGPFGWAMVAGLRRSSPAAC
jgi:Na+/proline symporter